MKTTAIIAEYNPFHNGHRLLIQAARAAGATAVIAVMGGNWLQRGLPALFPKEVRTRAALLSGVDLVLELPLPYAAATAQRFAYGAVALLSALGCVDALAFGSESGSLPLLEACAAALSDPRLDGEQGELRRRLDAGLPYAAARQQAVEALFGPETAAPLSRPNDTLAVQYLWELRRVSSPISPFTIPRQGAGHDSAAPCLPEDGDLPPTASASWLRRRILAGEIAETRPFLPAPAWEVFREAWEQGLWADPARLELPLLASLRRMSLSGLSALPDLSEGLEHRLFTAIRGSRTLPELLDRAKTRRYPHARLRRILLAAYLDIPAGAAFSPPPYIRVLGMTAAGREVLSRAKRTAALPVSSSPARLERLGGAAGDFAALEARSTDLYGLLLPGGLPCGTEYTNGIIVM